MISVLANIMPQEMHTMCQLFFEGQVKKSKDMQLELLRIMNAMFMDVNPVPVKAALSALGLCEEKYRLPLVPLKETDKEKLMEIMESYFLIQS